MTAAPDEQPGGPAPCATDVIDIAIRRDDAMVVTYADGEVATFPVATLRGACPCATCRGLRERGEEVWPRSGRAPATITIVDAQLTGAWGISIEWSDGHNTGIYTWSVLRRWWDTALDEPMVIDPTPEPPTRSVS